ncbi:hypothetical protein ACM39_05640 [Chryseobacterium sp. FH2]|uniref:hypothetical protein n=1 Tax=Chryseobacterium sp. FH2 TaxID=1674291 RepID=UPI00065B09E7|nr:hypothetical protein [Chryseobacterium sp. FH2]KMQ68771.1 hypothetical protein ACM39_05640 [Chryseobacterium sp. FH2]
MKQLLFFIIMISTVSVKAQLAPLTPEEKARMDSLSKIFDNNRKLEVLDVSLKKIFKKSGKYYATVEWNNLGKEPITSFSGILVIHNGEIGDGMEWLDTKPLPALLQPGQPQSQDYEAPAIGKMFPKLPKLNEVHLMFTAYTVNTTSNNFKSIRAISNLTKKEWLALLERDKDYTIYKELNERKQKYLQNEAKLKLLEGKFLKIDMVDGKPYVFCEFKNKSGQAINVYGTRISIQSGTNENSGWICSNGSDPDTYLKPNESIAIQCRMQNIPYDKMKFPVSDPSLYNLKITLGCDMIKLDDMTYHTVEFTKEDEEMLRLLNEKYK